MAKYTKNLILISISFLLFSIGFLVIFFNKNSRDDLIEQVQHRQQQSVRIGAKSIVNFFEYLGNTIIIISHNPIQENLDMFIESWSKYVTGVVISDKSGKAVSASNRDQVTEIGASVVEREYFQWAKTASRGEYKIFSPIISNFGSSKGMYVIPVAAPIYDLHGNFNGAVVSAVLVSDIVMEYLSDLKVIDSSKVYLVRSNGDIVYSDNEGLTGKNFENIFPADFIGKDKILDIFSKELKSKSESKLKIALPSSNKYYDIEPYLVAASPIELDNNLWRLVIALPERDLIRFTYNHFNKEILLLFLVVVIYIILILRLSKKVGYFEAVVDEHKIHNI